MDINYLIKQADKLIPSPRGGRYVYKSKYNTEDIINLMMYSDSKIDDRMCRFAKLFTRNRSGLYDLWKFVNKTQHFVTDQDNPRNVNGDEIVKSPIKIWSDRYWGNNCKGYSIFIASILKCNRIKYRYAFPTFKGFKSPTHVYVIATIGNVDYVLDSTVERFNYAEPYIERLEINPADKMALVYLDKPLGSAIGATQIQPGQRAVKTAQDKYDEAPKGQTAKPYFDIGRITEGDLTLELVKQRLLIESNYFGDPDRLIQNQLDLVNDVEAKLYSSQPMSISAPIQKQFDKLMYWINFAQSNTNKVAGLPIRLTGKNSISGPQTREEIIQMCQYIHNEWAKYYGLVAHTAYRKVGDGIFAKYEAYQSRTPFEYKPVYKNGTAYPADILIKDEKACQDQTYFANLFNEHLESSSHALIYEFLNPHNYDVGANTLNFKINTQQITNTNLGKFSQIDRANIIAWETVGIARIQAAKKMVDLTPQYFLDQFARIKGKGINEPFSILLGAIAAAIASCGTFLSAILEKRASLGDQLKGLTGSGVAPDPDDWINVIKETAKEGSYILPAAAAAAGIYLLTKK